MEEIVNACIDTPDDRDYTDEVLWYIEEKTIKPFPKSKLKIFNQWTDKDTLNSCTRQWLANITNWNNLNEIWTQEELLAKRIWLKAIDLVPWIKNNGDTLQNALNQRVEEKLIAWYYKIKGKEAHKKAINNGHRIYSWSSNWDWKSVKENKTYKLRTDWKIVWHRFVKWIEYNDKWLTAINSYWLTNWFFLLPWDLCDTTFTSYAIMDFIDEKPLNKYKAENIWNKERPDDIITRLELNTILKRLVASNKDFYNLTNPNIAPTLEEAKIMIKRALNKNLEITSLKRWEIISKLAI